MIKTILLLAAKLFTIAVLTCQAFAPGNTLFLWWNGLLAVVAGTIYAYITQIKENQ